MKAVALVLLVCAVSATLASDNEVMLGDAQENKCHLCQAIVGFAKDQLEKRVDGEKVIGELQKVCALVPNKNMAAQCKTTVETHGKRIVDLLENEVTPELICAGLAMCEEEEAGMAVASAPKCSACQFFVKVAEKAMTSDVAEDKVKTILDNLCSKSGKFADKCQAVVDEYAPKVIEALVAKEDPKKVCTLLKVCEAETMKFFDLELSGDAKTVKCELCTVVATYAKDAVEHIPADQVAGKLKEGCTRLPKFQAECSYAVDKYGEQIVKMLEEKVDPTEICHLIKACVPEEDNDMMEAIVADYEAEAEANSNDNPKCKLCMIMASFAKTKLDEKMPEKKVKEVLAGACQKYFKKYAAECEYFVTKVGLDMVADLRKNLEPANVCEKVKACDDKEKPEPEPVSDKCELCEAVVGLAEEEVKKHIPGDQILKNLEARCDKLPGGEKVTNACKNMVDEYGPKVVKMVEDKVTPALICAGLKVCTGEKAGLAIASAPKCAACEFFIKVTEKAITSDVAEEKIKGLLDNLCAKSGKFAEKCQAVVDEYAPKVIEAIVAKEDPKKVCTLLKLCEAEVEALPEPVIDIAGLSDDDAKCTMCKIVATYAKDAIEHIPSDKVAEKLKDGCSRLPKFQAECSYAVDKYGEKIIKMLEEKADPMEICQLIKACPKEDVIVVEPTVETFEPVEFEEATGPCQLCHLVVSYASHAVEKHLPEDKIKETMERGCSKLPGQWGDKCHDIVEQYAVKIIDMVIDKAASEVICAAIGLCVAEETQESVTGLDKCQVCETIVKYVAAFAGDKEDEIKAGLEKVCAMAPNADVKEQCTKAVDEYAPKIIDAVKSGDPKKACTELKMCTEQQLSALRGSMVI